MVITVMLCVLSLVLLWVTLRLEDTTDWKWYASGLAYGFSMSFTVNRFILLDSVAVQFLLNLFVVALLYLGASFFVGPHRRLQKR